MENILGKFRDFIHKNNPGFNSSINLDIDIHIKDINVNDIQFDNDNSNAMYLNKKLYIDDFIEFYEYLEGINKSFSIREDKDRFQKNPTLDNIRRYINHVNESRDAEYRIICVESLYLYFTLLILYNNYNMFENFKNQLSDNYTNLRNDNNNRVMKLLNDYSIDSNTYTVKKDGIQHLNRSIQKNQKHNKEYISAYQNISGVRKRALDSLLITIIIIFVALSYVQYDKKKLTKIYILIFLVVYYMLYRYQSEGFQGTNVNDPQLTSLENLGLTFLDYLEKKIVFIFFDTNITNGIQKEFHKYSKFDDIVKNENLRTRNQINNVYQSIYWWNIVNEYLILFLIGFMVYYLLLEMYGNNLYIFILFTTYIVVIIGFAIYRLLQKSRTQYGKNYW